MSKAVWHSKGKLPHLIFPLDLWREDGMCWLDVDRLKNGGLREGKEETAGPPSLLLAGNCPKHYHWLAFAFNFIASVFFQLNEEKECAVGDVNIAHVWMDRKWLQDKLVCKGVCKRRIQEIFRHSCFCTMGGDPDFTNLSVSLPIIGSVIKDLLWH